MCKHQVAWLLHEHPFGDPAERLMVRMLGTRLGFTGGCTMEDISDLTVALLQLRMQPNARAAEQPEARVTEAVAAAASPTEFPSQRAMDNHAERVRAEMERQLALLNGLAPERRRVFMQTHLSSVLQCTRLMETTAGKPFEDYSDISASHVSFKRHRNPLEATAAKRKHASNTTPAAQADFPVQQQDNAMHISKGFANKRTARQAAAHVQQCLDSRTRTIDGLSERQQAPAVAPPTVAQPSAQPLQARLVQSQPCTATRPPLQPDMQMQPPQVQPQSAFDPLALLSQYRPWRDMRRAEAAPATGNAVNLASCLQHPRRE